MTVGTSHQQTPHHSRVAVVDCQHERSVAVPVGIVQTGQVGLRQQKGHDGLAVHVGCPVEGAATELVLAVEIDPLPEEEQRQQHVPLGCHMKRVESRLGGNLCVGPLLHEVADDVDVP
jgi:hypothetical protein